MNKIRNSLRKVQPEIPNDMGTKWQSILPRCQALP
jgi:hypothetical protein